MLIARLVLWMTTALSAATHLLSIFAVRRTDLFGYHLDGQSVGKPSAIVTCIVAAGTLIAVLALHRQLKPSGATMSTFFRGLSRKTKVILGVGGAYAAINYVAAFLSVYKNTELVSLRIFSGVWVVLCVALLLLLRESQNTSAPVQA